jgi:hypothetical protein
MKTLLVLSITLSSFIAHASFYQSKCSDAFTNVITANGHVANYTKIKERVEGSNETVYTEYKSGELLKEVVKVTKIERISNVRCAPGSTAGMASWKNTNTSKMIIKKADGTAFPENTLGLSRDGLSIETTLICVLEGNSRSSCRQ